MKEKKNKRKQKEMEGYSSIGMSGCTAPRRKRSLPGWSLPNAGRERANTVFGLVLTDKGFSPGHDARFFKDNVPPDFFFGMSAQGQRRNDKVIK